MHLEVQSPRPIPSQTPPMLDLRFGPAAVLPDRVFANARTIADYAGTFQKGPLRRSFLDALTCVQPLRLDFHSEDAEIFLNFAPASSSEEEAFRTVMVVDSLPPGWAFSHKEQIVATRQVRNGLRVIQGIDPLLLEALRTIVGVFAMAKLPTYDGGSISNLIGVIWLGLNSLRPTTDFAEIIFHEYIHQSLFLEDMVHSIFLVGEGEMDRAEYKVISAIRKTPRGYDKSFHSAVVAMALAWFYRELGMVDKANKFWSSLGATMSELQRDTRFLSNHGQAVLADLVACYNRG